MIHDFVNPHLIMTDEKLSENEFIAMKRRHTCHRRLPGHNAGQQTNGHKESDLQIHKYTPKVNK